MNVCHRTLCVCVLGVGRGTDYNQIEAVIQQSVVCCDLSMLAMSSVWQCFVADGGAVLTHRSSVHYDNIDVACITQLVQAVTQM